MLGGSNSSCAMCISIDAPRFTGCTPAASNRTACRTVLRASPTSLPNQVAERVFCKATEWKPRELLLSCRVSWYTTNIRRTGLITPDRLGRLVTLKILLEASTSKTLIEACNFELYGVRSFYVLSRNTNDSSETYYKPNHLRKLDP